MNEHYVDFGGTGPLLHLATANGFPPETYHPMVTPLTARQRLVGYRYRPLWSDTQPANIASWHDLADDLMNDLATFAGDQPVIGMGHSLGGIITLYAALRQPKRFKALILIDTVIMPRYLLPIIWFRQKLRQHRRTRLVQGALRRRVHFPNAAAARAHYQGRGIFSGWHPAALEGYLAGGFRSASDGGVTLAWSPEWEGHIFSLVPIDTWNAITRVCQPMLLMRGKRSNVMIERTWADLQRLLPHATFVEVDGGHMLPMQQPQAVAAAVQAFLDAQHRERGEYAG